jgi:hypothetical protein
MRNLLKLALHPVRGTLFSVLSVLALIGLPAAARVFGGVWALVTFLALLVVLLTIAGCRLQGEHDQRMRPKFNLELRTEPLDEDLTYGAVLTGGRIGLWVRVTNRGPSAEFAARVENVRNARRADDDMPVGSGYSVDRVAWAETTEGRLALGRGQSGTLRLAEWAGVVISNGRRSGPVVYFLEATSAVPAPVTHALGWRLDATALETRPLAFDLTVSNVSADTHTTKHLAISFGDRSEVLFAFG